MNPYLPNLNDMLAMGVPEEAAQRWHLAIRELKRHADDLVWAIESNKSSIQNIAIVRYRELIEMIKK